MDAHVYRLWDLLTRLLVVFTCRLTLSIDLLFIRRTINTCVKEVCFITKMYALFTLHDGD